MTLFFCFVFNSALRQWRRGNIALITTLPVPDRPNSVQHLQARCPEDRFLPPQARKKATAKAQSLQHTISPLPAVLGLPSSLHLLTKEIQRKMTAQRCPCRLLDFKETFHKHARTVLRHNFQETVPGTVLAFFIRGSHVVLILSRHPFQHVLLTRDAQAKVIPCASQPLQFSFLGDKKTVTVTVTVT